MDDKKKAELREVADEFDLLRQLIRARLYDPGQPQMVCSPGDVCERNCTAELIAGRIIAARQTHKQINISIGQHNDYPGQSQ